MDSGITRKFGAYTTKELESFVESIMANETGSDACMRLIAMQDEIDRRKAGLSKPTVTPQITGGKVQNKIHRM